MVVVGDDAEVLRGILGRLLRELDDADGSRELRDLSAEVRQVLGALRDAGAVGGEVEVSGVVERVVACWGEVGRGTGAPLPPLNRQALDWLDGPGRNSPEAEALSSAVDAFTLARAARPLALWRAWHQEAPATSQRAMVQAVPLHRRIAAWGGNRSGKTEAGRAILVALVLGSDHPDARAFWTSHGVDPDLLPRGPGKGWIIAISSNDSLAYHRKQIDRLLPVGAAKWWNRNGPGEARLEISVPGYDLPAEITFKSDDQGVEAMQGDACRVILHDEEGPKYDTWAEADVRLWEQNGWHIMTNTPINGLTWAYYELHQRLEKVHSLWIHTMDNPFTDKTRALELEAEGGALAAARLRGEFVTLKGRVWEAWDRSRHVIPAAEAARLVEGCPRFRALDFGFRHPFVCLWGAVEKSGRIVVYAEHYQAGWTAPQHAAAIRSRPERVEGTWADPEDPQQLASLNLDHDLDAQPANNAIAYGISAVAERFRAGSLVVSDACENLIREVESYVWVQTDAGDVPRPKDDHTCDALRYMVVGVGSW